MSTEHDEDGKSLSPLKAMRHKCLECCKGNPVEVNLCTVPQCALFPYRSGRMPAELKRKLTPEQIEARKENAKRLTDIRRQNSNA